MHARSTGFVAAVGFAFEDSPWIARAAAAGRPFAGRDALHAAMVAIVQNASDAAQVALIQRIRISPAASRAKGASRQHQRRSKPERVWVHYRRTRSPASMRITVPTGRSSAPVRHLRAREYQSIDPRGARRAP